MARRRFSERCTGASHRSRVNMCSGRRVHRGQAGRTAVRCMQAPGAPTKTLAPPELGMDAACEAAGTSRAPLNCGPCKCALPRRGQAVTVDAQMSPSGGILVFVSGNLIVSAHADGRTPRSARCLPPRGSLKPAVGLGAAAPARPPAPLSQRVPRPRRLRARSGLRSFRRCSTSCRMPGRGTSSTTCSGSTTAELVIMGFLKLRAPCC